jgi:proteasome accessory factor B
MGRETRPPTTSPVGTAGGLGAASMIRGMHPLERLLNLVILLLDTTRPLTFEQIRDRLPGYGQDDLAAAKRMFERDKDVLRDLGIPVEVEPTDAWDVEDGYRIPKDRYYLPEIAFTAEEISALFVAAQTPGEGGDAEEAVRKLQAGVEPSVLAGLVGRPAAGADLVGPRLVAVTEAIERRRSLRFGYRPVSGDGGERHVDPYALVWATGHWYLVGRDRDRDEVRSYRLSRFLSDPDDGGDGSAPPDGFDARQQLRLSPWGTDQPDVEARVAFSPEVAWWAVPTVPEAKTVDAREDGWVEVSLPASRGDSFLSWVLSFGPEAVVLAPDEARREVIRRLEAAIAAG